MLNPKTAVKLVPALALAAVIGSPLSAFAAPAVTLGADNAVESSEQGTATANVPVTLTADGSWLDKGGTSHDLGKYVVTVPTSISVKGISAGSNDIRVPYKVNVAGIIGSGKKVTARADTDRHSGSYMLTVTQGKTEFTAEDISNGTNDNEGVLHINGSDSTDTLSTQQDVWYSDSVTGNVTYSFAIA
jgi:hypothetical protein